MTQSMDAFSVLGCHLGPQRRRIGMANSRGARDPAIASVLVRMAGGDSAPVAPTSTTSMRSPASSGSRPGRSGVHRPGPRYACKSVGRSTNHAVDPQRAISPTASGGSGAASSMVGMVIVEPTRAVAIGVAARLGAVVGGAAAA